MDMKKYYSQLIGAKIIGFEFEKDEYSLEPFPVFKLSFGEQKIKMSISMDTEGNGGGFAFIEDLK
jgi:hypothetical protein